MKLLIITIISIIPFFSCSSQNFIRLSKEIDSTCGQSPNKRGFTFHDLRKTLYKEGRLNFLEKDFDTLYILESYSIHDGVYRSEIWNRNGNIQFTYGQSGFKFNQEKIFTDYTVKLIQNWDTVEIRKEENLYSNYIPVYYIKGIRVIRKEKNSIECIKFKEFINPKRD